ncbi:MAG TPA: hypothetical protein VGE11_26200 [Pseudonocardia sp.]
MTAPRPEPSRPEPPNVADLAPRADLAPLADAAELSELSAGLPDEGAAREVRAAAEADPAARAVLDALTATRAELAQLPDPPVPPALAARWSAALRAEQTRLSTRSSPGLPSRDEQPVPPHPAPPHTPTLAEYGSGGRPTAPLPSGDRRPAARRRSSSGRRALPRRPAVLAGALLVAVLVGGGLLHARHEQLPTLDRPQLLAQGLSTVGVRDAGGLDDPARRTACLHAVAAPGVTPTAPLLGGRRVVFQGSPGLLLVLGTGRRGTFDVVVVDPECGPGGGTLLASTHVAPP